jgi:hypothetical protein
LIGHMKPRPLPSQVREGDAANVVLTAVGHNLRLVLAWLRLLLRLILSVLPRLLVGLAAGAVGHDARPS